VAGWLAWLLVTSVAAVVQALVAVVIELVVRRSFGRRHPKVVLDKRVVEVRVGSSGQDVRVTMRRGDIDPGERRDA
jgi:hypothetical protein